MRTGTFNFIILLLFVLGLIAAAAGFAVALSTDAAAKLANAGSFVSGLTAIFGMMTACMAILIYVRAENVKTKAAAAAWQAKLRLEDAIHSYLTLLRWEMVDSPLSSVDMDGLYMDYGLRCLEEAFAEARRAGLYRVLTLVPNRNDDECGDGETFARVEAIVQHDLRAEERDDGEAYLLMLPDFWERLAGIDEDDLRKVLSTALDDDPIEAAREAEQSLPPPKNLPSLSPDTAVSVESPADQ